MTLKVAKTLFPETLSPCCSAIVHKSVCCECGTVIAMPYYFQSRRQVPDEELIEIEQSLRPKLPVGVELVMAVK